VDALALDLDVLFQIPRPPRLARWHELPPMGVVVAVTLLWRGRVRAGL